MMGCWPPGRPTTNRSRARSRSIPAASTPTATPLGLRSSWRRGTWLLFDDVAVSHAIRSVLAGPPVDVVSTFVTGDDRFVGAITAVHDDEPTRLRDDPFAAIFPTCLVRAGPGLLGRTPTPVGPMTQRYGAANPWPWDRFPEARA